MTNCKRLKFAKWNRIRAALFSLLKQASNPDLPCQATEVLQIIIESECEAVRRQCSSGPQSGSNIFCDDVVSSENVPGGVFVRVLGEVIQRANDGGVSLGCLHSTLATIVSIKAPVLSVVLSKCPDPVTGAFCDPRPALTEAWLLLVSELICAAKQNSTTAVDGVADVICDTAVAVVTLLLFPSVGKTQEERMNDPGLSLDGPHSLAIAEFLSRFFGLGPTLVQRVADYLESSVPTVKSHESGRSSIGTAIIGAALFRASQGGLPPWAVESVPEVYSAFFVSMGRDPQRFGETMRMSMAIRLDSSAVQFRGVKPGCLLSGPLFEPLSTELAGRFVEDAANLARADDAASWRRFKVAVKQVCGGKKKDAEFHLKPSYTRWEFDRI
jgi:hypothetical protein